ncbi:MAG: cytochrome c biogenesis protein ResB [Planctomycetota bacterium]
MNNEVKVTFKIAVIGVLSLIITGFFIDKLGGIPKILSDFSKQSILYKFHFFIAIGGIIMMLWLRRTLLVKILISPRFAVAVLLAIAFFTILGTLIIQNGSYADYINVYGKNIADFFYKFHLTDIFHSYYFGILLFVLTVSLALVIVNRKPFKLTQIGFTLSHGGIILLLIGGLIGIIYGEKGFIHFVKGEKPVNTIKILKNGREAGEKKLDFAISLDDFKVEYYDEEGKISIYQKEKEGYRYLFSVNPSKTKEFQLPGGIRTIRVINKNMYESPHEKIKIPYFEIEVERPRPTNISGDSQKNLPHHGIERSKFTGPVQLILAPDNPLPFDNNNFIVALEQRKEPRLFESILSIYENNVKKITSPVRVNSPLTYKGYKFYQSNYNPENSAYSGILVVRDPGLFLVYAGFIMFVQGLYTYSI